MHIPHHFYSNCPNFFTRKYSACSKKEGRVKKSLLQAASKRKLFWHSIKPVCVLEGITFCLPQAVRTLYPQLISGMSLALGTCTYSTAAERQQSRLPEDDLDTAEQNRHRLFFPLNFYYSSRMLAKGNFMTFEKICSSLLKPRTEKNANKNKACLSHQTFLFW